MNNARTPRSRQKKAVKFEYREVLAFRMETESVELPTSLFCRNWQQKVTANSI